ncbi:DHA2 family methylenomycin A resistance protein-like MFS transporter [Bradyrhizobium sp. USDA 4524]|uniref:MFS transporter n=1 Tax=unclassified Bradyrhizobium TaxID=2631580 RepID=UPI0020A18AD6|nr:MULTISPECIES: MFS transporter [unclassified Bradyrhizobium]MCP1840259.1 DHA2 family methylenomycin A resistance protein-like MFS transporter [Bradyrhizobium sp. USDA 4538]MCP1900822.1 DHA2 family methylenomycin A resistance protein-like MFS transporter [Bradyrhizobium sp. USDA 4537]MCP1993522.1 DHA2 family methylenomycin A resistance protein-like MFS transporter [Bradyrhizobium sp. USDA 4539]
MQTTSLDTRQPEQAGSDSALSRSPLAAALALAATSLGLGVVQLDITIVNTALSSISTSLGGSVAELQWVVTAYTIAFAAFILTAGALGDRVGAKRIFIGGFAIFTLASLACALAPSAMFLIVARSVQGLAAAILVPNSLTLLNHAYTDPKARGRAVGFWAAGASVALTAGPLVGGALIALVSWRAIFLVNLPIGAAGLWLAWRYAEETPRLAQREIDLPGQIAAIATLGALAGALIEGGALGWSHPLVIMGFAGAAVIGLLFVWREARAPQPMLPLSLFRHHMFALTALVGLLFNIAFYGLIFVLSLYFQNVNGWSPFATGLAFVPMMAMVLPANLITASASERLGAPQTIALACMITAAGCVALLPMASGTSYGAIGAQLLILGGGLGLLVPSLTSTLLGSVEKSRSGIAAGVLNATRQTGSVLGVALFGSLVAGNNAFMAGVHASLVISAAVLLAGAVAIWQGRAKEGR